MLLKKTGLEAAVKKCQHGMSQNQLAPLLNAITALPCIASAPSYKLSGCRAQELQFKFEVRHCTFLLGSVPLLSSIS